MVPGAKFKRDKVEVFGYSISYAEAGSGSVIVSLPGSAGLEMSTAKDVLSEHFRVVELDPPGWGESHALAGLMKQRNLATILGEAIAELSIERFHLIGTSMGGTNAAWLAMQQPKRVLSLTLEGPMINVRIEDHVNPASGGLVAAIRAGVISYDSNTYAAPPPHPRKPWATPDFFHEQMRRRFKMMAQTDYPGINEDLESFLSSTEIPTTLLLGTEDEILRPSYAEQFKRLCPSARLVMIEGATHDIQNTAPERFVEAIITNAGATV